MFYINHNKRAAKSATIHKENCETPALYASQGLKRLERGYWIQVSDLEVAEAVIRDLRAILHYGGCCRPQDAVAGAE